jgi:hypothetical protein
MRSLGRMLLDGQNLPETYSADWKINKLLLLHLVGHLHYLFSSTHGQTHIKYISLICDKGVTTQNLAFSSYWYRKKCLQMHF